MALIQITEDMILNAEDIIAAVRRAEGLRIIMHGTIREIEIGERYAESAWARLAEMCSAEHRNRG